MIDRTLLLSNYLGNSFLQTEQPPKSEFPSHSSLAQPLNLCRRFLSKLSPYWSFVVSIEVCKTFTDGQWLGLKSPMERWRSPIIMYNSILISPGPHLQPHSTCSSSISSLATATGPCTHQHLTILYTDTHLVPSLGSWCTWPLELLLKVMVTTLFCILHHDDDDVLLCQWIMTTSPSAKSDFSNQWSSLLIAGRINPIRTIEGVTQHRRFWFFIDVLHLDSWVPLYFLFLC